MILRTELARENWKRFQNVKLVPIAVKLERAKDFVKRENLKGDIYYLYCYMCRSVVVSLRENVKCACLVCRIYVEYVNITEVSDTALGLLIY